MFFTTLTFQYLPNYSTDSSDYSIILFGRVLHCLSKEFTVELFNSQLITYRALSEGVIYFRHFWRKIKWYVLADPQSAQNEPNSGKNRNTISISVHKRKYKNLSNSIKSR